MTPDPDPVAPPPGAPQRDPTPRALAGAPDTGMSPRRRPGEAGEAAEHPDVAALARRAELLRTGLDVALEVGRIALWRHDLASDRIYLDQRAFAMIGLPFSADGVTIAEARARVHPHDVPALIAAAAQTLRTGEPTDTELRYPLPGGGWRHVLSRRALERDAGGRPLGFVGVLLDVSDRFEETRRALDAGRRLEAAAEAARIGLWSTRLDTPLPSWNPRMFTLFGLDPRDGALALDDWLARCVHADDRPRVRSEVVDWWHAGHGERAIEFRVVRPSDGALRWLVVRGNIEPVLPANTRRAEGVAIDITEQHQTLRQLHDTVARMRLTTRALGLGTWTAGADHAEIVWDEQMFRLRGVESPARAIVTDEVASFVHPDDQQSVIAEQMLRIADLSPWRRNFRVQWPDGQVRWLASHSVAVFDEQGRPAGRIGVNWDITEAQLAATARHERELAVAESQAKSQAMSRISHELRTPLNAVLGFTQLLRGTVDDADAGQRARWLGHVEDAGRHLLALIDDVLELSSAEIGKVRLAAEPVAVAAVVQAALALVAGAAQQQRVALHCQALDGVMLADPVRLRQVLINLLSNAIKYNRPGGEVRLWSSVLADRVALHVRDSGAGIAPERLQHAFEPFNRLGAESTAVQGSGIGLAIVKVLVKGMGGRVEVRSQLGQGSEFIVWLPAATPEAAEAAAPPAPAPDAAGSAAATTSARVLYIEDNPVNALLVREMLALRPGVALEIAEDGRSGVLRALETRPELILIDMQLPDIDGHAVLRALRADARTAGIRCVALTANATPADRLTAREAGFADYWTKPIDLQRFLAGVDELLARPALEPGH